MQRPWDDGSNSVRNAQNRARVAFEFIQNWARRSTPSTTATSRRKASTLSETNKNLDAVVQGFEGRTEAHRRQTALGHGEPVFQSALRSRREHELQRRRFRLCRRAGEEGAGSHPRTGRRRLRVLGRARRVFHPAEHRHETRAGASGQLLHLAVDYKKQIGFKGQFYIEPKPKEPTKHQYDSDAAACLNFLREYRPAARTSS